MTKTATVDLEFKTSLVGYDDLVEKVDKLIEKVNALSASTGEIKAPSAGGGGEGESTKEKATSKFTKMLVKFGSAAGAFALFTKMVTTVVKQSQVYSSLVQLVFHPFIIMVNFMLLPVLKWILPHVIEWLQWTVDNKAGLDAFGGALSTIGEALLIVGDETVWNPFKEFIELLTSLTEIEESDADGLSKLCDKIKEFAAFDFDIFSSHPLLSGMDWIFTIVEGFINGLLNGFKEAFHSDGGFDEKVSALFGNLFTDIWESIKTVFLDFIGSIPFLGSGAREWWEDVLNTPPGEPGGRLGVDASSLTPAIDISNLTANNSTNNWGLMLWNSDLNTSNVNRFNSTETSLLRARIGPL